MQLILESEPIIDIEREMSAVDDIQTEIVGNGNIEQLKEKSCNGNKENIAEDNIIPNEELSKEGENADFFSDKLENIEKETSIVDINEKETSIVDINEKETSIVDINEKETCEDNSSKDIDSTTTEESQNNVIGKETNNVQNKEEIEENPEEIIPVVEDEEVKLDQKLDVIENDSENVVTENDVTTIKEDLLTTKDDVQIIEEPASTEQKECEIVEDVELEEIAEKSEPSETKDKQIGDSNNDPETVNCTLTEEITTNDAKVPSPIELRDDMDVEEIVEETKSNEQTDSQDKETASPVNSIVDKPVLCKLSNTLDILSDDEEEPPTEDPPKETESNEKQCINIEDDDDIMLIDEETTKTETRERVDSSSKEDAPTSADAEEADSNNPETENKVVEDTIDLFYKPEEKESTPPAEINESSPEININEKQEEEQIEKCTNIPLLPENFLKSAKKNISDMTREDLEEFCIIRIVESIVDRSNLSEIKNKLKTMAQGIEEYRKKAMMLTKQNRDLQVVLKSIQEEQKNNAPGTPITPLKITRSVGMQVYMEKAPNRRKNQTQQLLTVNNNNTANRQNAKNVQTPNPGSRLQKVPLNNQSIPVPRLVPANGPAIKTPSAAPLVNQITPIKAATPLPNGIKTPSPTQKVGEKRQHNRITSVTVDLTDDEPPTKMNNRISPAPPVRVVPSQNLMANPRQPFATSVSSPRKVYIPISGPQSQTIRPGQTIMLKTVPTPGLRQRCPTQVGRIPTGPVRVNRIQTGRHPAPLPDAMKQYQPPNWKALPPAPDLKLSKVENGIVISWKIEGYQEDSYEEIASYQLYAYQETSSPPSTSLWKKIGDVKALPLPMACTLTQFMAGFKYFFAVRAVDVRSRLGPFSLPGSILLLNKL